VPNELSKDQLQRLARLGAQARLDELEAERRAIVRAFPDLAPQRSRPAKAGAAATAEADQAAVPAKARKRGRRKMSAAQKKAQSERMKSIWAARKKAGS
jgi:hypothetical protein